MIRPHYITPEIEEGLPLFTQRAPAVLGSATSAMAAGSLGPATLNAMQRRVLELLRDNLHGLTDEEQQVALAMNPSTQRPRRIELVQRYLVVGDGTRKTRSGRMAVVWKATSASC